MDVRLLIKLHDNFIRSNGSYFDFLIKKKNNYEEACNTRFLVIVFFMIFKAFQMIIVLVK
ncbi:hypothetical protein AFR78_00765 [Listeria monocytogenes]|nr:hypothetical protein [Listeria monocytogenes]EAD9922782.1 hypothetical protein [Listeria monocytogenes]